MIQRVFISSTLEDLLQQRQAAAEAVRQLGLHSVDIFQNQIANKDLVAGNLWALTQADLFIGLYALRYGELLPDEDISLTERLYNEALHLRLPRLIYLARQDKPLNGAFLGADAESAQMRVFLERLQAENPNWRYFNNPADLAEKLSFDLGRLKARSTQPYRYNRRHFMLGLLLVWCVVLLIALRMGPIF